MSHGTDYNIRKDTSRWGPRMILILMAMLTVSMAFFSGLYIQSNLPFFPSLIGGVAIFLTLYGTLPVRKPARTTNENMQARFALFENEIVNLSGQFEQFQGLSGKMGQLDQLGPTLMQLEGFLEEMKTQGVDIAQLQGEGSDTGTDLKLDEFSQKLKQLDNRIAEINNEVADQGADQQTQLQTQIENLDKLVQKMAHAETGSSSASQKFAPQPGEIVKDQSPKTVNQIRQRVENSRTQLNQNLDKNDPATDEDQILSIITKAIENRRLDIFLQPVVSLPKRKTAFYEVFTRLRNESNNLILPDTFIPVAEGAGLMPLIDNMMLLRAIKIIRQMDQRTSAKGLFCSLSTQSLVDPDFFPKLVAFLEKNKDLSGRIIFEISQAQKKTAGPIERDGMRRLAGLGFHFSLDKVIDLDIDFDDLARMNFKYVRISADRLINGMAELGARIHGADKADYLQRFGLHLIVERIESERELATLADYSIKLGQGYLFAEPRPIRAEILGERAA